MSRTNYSSFGSSIARLVLAGMATASVLAALPAAADPIQVVVDQAKVMHMSRPADLVIIGNPAIADATIQDSQTLIITGHSFGMTNLIVLDADGLVVADENITVAPQNEQVVTVYRRASRQTYSCTPDCSPMLAVGDNTAAFDSVNSQIQSQTSLSTAAATK